jgi:hypothetical protein
VTASMADMMARVWCRHSPHDHDVDNRSGIWTATILRVRRLLLLLVVPLLAATGCSELGDRLSDSVNGIASRALENGVRQQLADAGIELQSGPDCATDMSRDGTQLTGSASCAGVTVDGQEATATFNGSLSSSGCTGTVTVVVDGRTVLNAAEVPDCSVSL